MIGYTCICWSALKSMWEGEGEVIIIKMEGVHLCMWGAEEWDTEDREDSAIEITLLASICIGSSGAILKFGGEWWTALYLWTAAIFVQVTPQNLRIPQSCHTHTGLTSITCIWQSCIIRYTIKSCANVIRLTRHLWTSTLIQQAVFTNVYNNNTNNNTEYEYEYEDEDEDIACIVSHHNFA